MKIRGFASSQITLSVFIKQSFNVQACELIVDKTSELEDAELFVMSRDNALTDRMIQEAISKEFPKFIIIKKVIFINEFPLNRSGKVDKSSLLQKYHASIAAEVRPLKGWEIVGKNTESNLFNRL